MTEPISHERETLLLEADILIQRITDPSLNEVPAEEVVEMIADLMAAVRAARRESGRGSGRG